MPEFDVTNRVRQLRVLAILWLVLGGLGVIFVTVDLVRTAGSYEGVTPSGLFAVFSFAAIAVAAALGLLLRKRWGRPLSITLSTIALILLVPNGVGALVNSGWDDSSGFIVYIAAPVLVSAYGLWLLVPSKGRQAYEEYLRTAD